MVKVFAAPWDLSELDQWDAYFLSRGIFWKLIDRWIKQWVVLQHTTQILWVALKRGNVHFEQNPRMAEAVCWADPGRTPKAALSLLFSTGQGEKTTWEAWGVRWEQGEMPDQCLSRQSRPDSGILTSLTVKSQQGSVLFLEIAIYYPFPWLGHFLVISVCVQCVYLILGRYFPWMIPGRSSWICLVSAPVKKL